MITLIPFSERSFPANPRISQEGDQLQRMARAISSFTAFCRVSFAPYSKKLVTSSPVTDFLSFFSGQVKKALPFFRLIGGRGQGNPPNISGQTEISSTSGFSLMKRFTNELNLSFLPCQRQEIPKRQDETKTFLSFILTSTLNLRRRNILVNIWGLKS